MTSLNPRARRLLERNYDLVCENPSIFEEGCSTILKTRGIETDLEKVVSYVNGFMYGLVECYYNLTLEKTMDEEERKELYLIMRRKDWEIRHSLISARIKLSPDNF